jgi:hypothetical protein
MWTIAVTAAMRPWTAAYDTQVAVFGYTPTYVAPVATPLPQVWPGRGLAAPQAAAPGLLAAVTTVLTAAAARRGALRATMSRHHATGVWTRTRTDPADRYLYLDGPASRWNGAPGYQHTCTLTPDLPELHRQLAAARDSARPR